MVPNIVKDSSTTPLFAVDEVEQVQRQRIASLISHMFQQTYANMVKEVIQQEKLNRCYGCTGDLMLLARACHWNSHFVLTVRHCRYGIRSKIYQHRVP